MRKMRKRLMAWVLAVSMMVGMFAVPAYAEEGIPAAAEATVVEELPSEEAVVEETAPVEETVVEETEEAEESAPAVEEAETETETEAEVPSAEAATNANESAAAVDAEQPKKEMEEEKSFELGHEVTGYAVPLSEDKALDAAHAGSTTCPTPAQAQAAMYALKSQYPEGMHWTNDNYYDWKGGIYGRGYGCAGFAFQLSDAAFGDLPARQINTVSIGMLHSGDILRVMNDQHSVIVMEVYADHIVIAEGNYNSSIHWGRTMSASEVAASDYVMTRYPVGFFGNSYTIHYNLNGGSGEIVDQPADAGIATSITTTIPVRHGYDFLGWATSAGATAAQVQAGGSYTGSADVTLYAVWKKASYQRLGNAYPINVSVTISNPYEKKIFEFVPDATAYYTFESSGDLDTYISVLDKNLDEICTNDDSGVDNNFKLEYAFRAGETYYIEASLYSSHTGSYAFQVKKGEEVDHIHEADHVEGVREATCTEEGYTGDQVCTCGAVLQSGESIPATGHRFTNYVFNDDATDSSAGTETASCDYGCGETYTRPVGDAQLIIENVFPATRYVNITEDSPSITYFFTPETAGIYEFYSTGDRDTIITIYDEEGNEIGRNDDGGESQNFELAVILAAGTTYRVTMCIYDNGVGSFAFVVDAPEVQYEKNERFTLKSGEVKEYSITPDESAIYYFTCVGSVPMQIQLYDTEGNVLLETPSDREVVMWELLAKGERYIVRVKQQSGTEATLTMVSWVETLGYDPIIPARLPYTTHVVIGIDELKPYLFTPSESGKYEFRSTGNADPYITVSDEKGVQIGGADDVDGRNFWLMLNLTAGKTYKVELGAYSASTYEYDFTVRKHTHTPVTIPAVAATYTATGLTAGQKCSVCGQVTVAQKTVAKKVLAAPTTTVANAAKGITVKWTRTPDADGYKIYRKTGSGSYKLIKTITSGATLSYNDNSTALKNGTAYTYAVRAYKGSLLSSFTGKKMIRMTKVAISSLKNSGTKAMTVKWSKNAKATGYQIQYSTSKTFKSGNKTVTAKGAATVSKVIKSLTKGKTYYVRIRAYKTSGGVKYYSAWCTKKYVKISR